MIRRRAARSRRVGTLLAASVLLAGLAGCATIPSSGAPVAVSTIPGAAASNQLVGPSVGQGPEQVVREFIQATAQTADDTTAGVPFAAAKAFLTPQAAAAWTADTASTPVVVISSDFNPQPDSTNPGTVVISATQVGLLRADRSYQTTKGTTFTETLHLTEVEGRWEISQPPPDVVLTTDQFGTAFQLRDVYFLDATGQVVVPDPRYLPNVPTANSPTALAQLTATRLMTLLLGGPSPGLGSAARTILTSGKLEQSVLIDPNTGVAHVDLTGVAVASPTARLGLIAQVVWTLTTIAQQVTITVNGQPLGSSTAAAASTALTSTAAGTAAPTSGTATGPASAGTIGSATQPVAQDYTLSDVESFNPDASPASAAPAVTDAYYVDPSGALLRLSDDNPIWGPIGTGSQPVTATAISAATGELAAVTEPGDGSQSLLIEAPFEHGTTTTALKATSLTPPSFTRNGDEVWTVQNAATDPEIVRVSLGSGTPTHTQVAAPQLSGLTPVTDLVLSRDGVRVAVVANSQLYVGVIQPVGDVTGSTTGAAAGLTVTGLTLIRPDLTDVSAVAFQDAQTLLVAAKNGSSSYRTVFQVSIDGQSLAPLTTDGIFGNVDAIATYPGSSDKPVLISFDGDVWALDGSTTSGRWVQPRGSTVYLPGSAPLYPN